MRKTLLFIILILTASTAFAGSATGKQIQNAYEKIVNTIKTEKFSEEKQKAVWMTFLKMYGDDREYSGTLRDLEKLAEKIKISYTRYTEPLTGMEFVFVKGGCYQMGDMFGDGESDERPVHEVCVDDFYMGKYEVTVGNFQNFVNATSYRTEAEQGDGCSVYKNGSWKEKRSANWRNPGFSQSSDKPVVCVSWNDVKAFIRWLNSRSSLTFRLPTEAEWEYAARSGGKREKYAGSNNPGEVAWHYYNSGWSIYPVGQKKANGLGIYDMSGNVWEWVEDVYSDKAYSSHSRNNPIYVGSGDERVLRGGSWDSYARYVRAANRASALPGYRFNDTGFRLLLQDKK